MIKSREISTIIRLIHRIIKKKHLKNKALKKINLNTLKKREQTMKKVNKNEYKLSCAMVLSNKYN